MELAKELESADSDMKLLHGQSIEKESAKFPTSSGSTQAVHKVGCLHHSYQAKSLKCFRCGVLGHITSKM